MGLLGSAPTTVRLGPGAGSGCVCCGLVGFWARWFGGGFVEFVVLFEGAVFAVEGAFRGGFVAEEEVVHFEFFGRPIEGRTAVERGAVGVIIALAADAEPFGLGGFEDEIVEGGVFGVGLFVVVFVFRCRAGRGCCRFGTNG